MTSLQSVPRAAVHCAPALLPGLPAPAAVDGQRCAERLWGQQQLGHGVTAPTPHRPSLLLLLLAVVLGLVAEVHDHQLCGRTELLLPPAGLEGLEGLCWERQWQLSSLVAVQLLLKLVEL